jgi:hypothetical protein
VVVDREVFVVREGAIVWFGAVGAEHGRATLSARERFEEAWRRALQDGAVTPADAGIVQFRSYKPDVRSLRRIGLRAVRVSATA